MFLYTCSISLLWFFSSNMSNIHFYKLCNHYIQGGMQSRLSYLSLSLWIDIDWHSLVWTKCMSNLPPFLLQEYHVWFNIWCHGWCNIHWILHQPWILSNVMSEVMSDFMFDAMSDVMTKVMPYYMAYTRKARCRVAQQLTSMILKEESGNLNF